MNIRMRQLRAFKAIVDTGSVTEAAGALGLTQSTVSKLLAAFENELGFLLFERIGRRLRLSEQGRMFYHKSGNAIELLDGIQAAALDIRDNQGQRLRVSAIGPIALSGLIPEALTRFSMEFQDFSYSVEMKSRIEIEDWVANRHADLGFTLLPVDENRLNARPLASVQAVAAVPRTHSLAKRNALSPEQVKDSDLVMPKASVRVRGLVEAGFVQAGIELHPRFETSNAISTVSLVSQGLGIAIVDPFTLTGADRKNLKVLAWLPETILNYGLIWPAHRNLTHHEERFFETAINVYRDLRRDHSFIKEN